MMDTKSRILDTAEKLFAENGFSETSLRDITTEAAVNLAAVNYHFQSKDSLIDAVILRRIEPVNCGRIEMLNAAGPDPTVEQIVEAYLTPIILIGHPTPAWVPLVGRILSSPDLFLERVFKKHLAAMSQRFGEALAKALPELGREELLWRMHFMGGVMTHVLLWSHFLPAMTDGVCDTADKKAVVARAVAFLSAGFHAPAAIRTAQEGD
jgi:AcrR family transcriptional regulator